MMIEELARALVVLEARVTSIERQLAMIRELLSRCLFIPAGPGTPPPRPRDESGAR